MKRVPKKRKYTPERVAELSGLLRKWIDTAEELWLGNFAKEQGFHRDRMLEFAEIDENFAEVFTLAKQAQENWLVTSALARKVDTTMAIFALKNVAGWRDKQEHEHTGDITITNLVAEVENKNRLSTCQN